MFSRLSVSFSGCFCLYITIVLFLSTLFYHRFRSLYKGVLLFSRCSITVCVCVCVFDVQEVEWRLLQRFVKNLND